MSAAALLYRFLQQQGMPSDPPNIRRERVEAFIVDQLDRWRTATASLRFRALQQFLKWCGTQGEITESPMARTRPPIIPEEPIPVLSQEALQAILKV